MQIREAKYSDLESIIEIYNESINGKESTADLSPVSVYDRLDWFQSHSLKTYPLLVFVEDEKVCGWAALNPFYGRAAYKITAEISVYVHSTMKQKGIASQLIQELINLAMTNGFQHILAYVFAHNEKSLKLFKKFQFVPQGTFPQIANMGDFKADLMILQRSF